MMPEPLVGREKQLAACQELLAAGSGCLGFEGTSGVGKTALLRAGARLAGEAGFTVLTGRGRQLEQNFGFGVVRAMFSPLFAVMPAGQLAELLAGPAGPAAALVSPQPDGFPDGDSFGMLHALYWLTVRLAERRPLMLAIDDVQWADAPSLRWLLFLARRAEGVPIVLATTRNTGDAGTAPDLVDELADAITTITVPPLSMPDAAELVTTLLDRAPEPGFAAACHHITQGNPFLLTALVNAFAVEQRDPTWESVGKLAALGPQAVSRWLTDRTRKLPVAALDLAKTLVILEDQADLGTAAAVAGMSPEQAVETADALTTMGILAQGHQPGFVHLIVRNAIAQDMSAAERLTLHARAARLLHDQHKSAEHVAAHLLATDPIDEPWTTGVLREAAKIARRRAAPDLSVLYLRSALAQVRDQAGRLAILAELGKSELLCLDHEPAQTHLAEAFEAAGQPEAIAAIGSDLATAIGRRGDIKAASAVLERVITRLGPAEDLVAAMEAAALVYAQRGDSPGWPDRARKALDSPSPLLRRMATAATATHFARSCGSREHAEELVGQVLGLGPPLSRSCLLALTLAGGAAAFADRADLAAQCADMLMDFARANGERMAAEWAHLVMSRVAHEQGRPEDTLDEIQAAVDVDEIVRDGSHGPDVYMTLAESYVELGRPDDVLAMCTSLGLADLDPVPDVATYLLNARGRIRLLNGDAQGALTDHLRFGRYAEQSGRTSPACSDWRSRAALAYHHLGRHTEAKDTATTELEMARDWGTARTIGIATRVLGQIGDDIDRLQESVDVLASSSAHLEHARSVGELGQAWLSRGEQTHARTCFHQTFRLASECGAQRLADAAMAALRRAGGRRPRAATSALTAKQRLFAELAAAGHTNREIAEQQFVSLRTVEHHLTAAYRKLEITSRDELVVAMSRA